MNIVDLKEHLQSITEVSFQNLGKLSENFIVKNATTASRKALKEKIHLEVASSNALSMWTDNLSGISHIRVKFSDSFTNSEKMKTWIDGNVSIQNSNEQFFEISGKILDKSESNEFDIEFNLDGDLLNRIVFSNFDIAHLEQIQIEIDESSFFKKRYNDEVSNKKNQEVSRQNSLIEKNNGKIKQQQLNLNELKREVSRVNAEISEKQSEYSRLEVKLNGLKRSLKDFPDTLDGYREQSRNLTVLYSFFILLSIFSIWFISDYFMRILQTNELPSTFSILDAIAFAFYKSPATALALGVLAFIAKLVGAIYKEVLRLNDESLKMTQLTVLAQTAYNSVSKSSDENKDWNNDEWHNKAVEAKLQLITKVFTKELKENESSEKN